MASLALLAQLSLLAVLLRENSAMDSPSSTEAPVTVGGPSGSAAAAVTAAAELAARVLGADASKSFSFHILDETACDASVGLGPGIWG